MEPVVFLEKRWFVFNYTIWAKYVYNDQRRLF